MLAPVAGCSGSVRRRRLATVFDCVPAWFPALACRARAPLAHTCPQVRRRCLPCRLPSRSQRKQCRRRWRQRRWGGHGRTRWRRYACAAATRRSGGVGAPQVRRTSQAARGASMHTRHRTRRLHTVGGTAPPRFSPRCSSQGRCRLGYAPPPFRPPHGRLPCRDAAFRGYWRWGTATSWAWVCASRAPEPRTTSYVAHRRMGTVLRTGGAPYSPSLETGAVCTHEHVPLVPAHATMASCYPVPDAVVSPCRAVRRHVWCGRGRRRWCRTGGPGV